jgi:hypothetical protein
MYLEDRSYFAATSLNKLAPRIYCARTHWCPQRKWVARAAVPHIRDTDEDGRSQEDESENEEMVQEEEIERTAGQQALEWEIVTTSLHYELL